MIAFDGTFAGFRDAARAAIHAGIDPAHASFDDGGPQKEMFGSTLASTAPLRVPRRYVELGETVAMHADPRRWPTLYRVLWRLVHGEHELLGRSSDPDIRVLERMVAGVRRDIHKVHAFVRFRKLELDDGPLWVSFYRPDHHVLAAAVPHFVARMGDAAFVLATPEGTARWDGKKLSMTAPAPELIAAAAANPDEQEIESLFKSYYASVFNPARLNLRATVQEMPKHLWKQIPEAQEIARLVADAPHRTEGMVALGQVAHPPAGASLPVLREAASSCTACDIACNATQTVFGEGPADARIVLIGEQPGDEEDRHGHPFIGPAGKLLRGLVEEAELDMSELYVTNAVKHFKWEPRGKRRLHMKPAYREVKACHPWLDAELHQVRPAVIVCLGATAAQSLLGSGFRLTQHRGKIVPQPWARAMLTTFHPSAILRMDGEAADDARAQLLADLRRAKKLAVEEAASAKLSQ